MVPSPQERREIQIRLARRVWRFHLEVPTVLRAGLETGLIRSRQVVEWANERLLEEDPPSHVTLKLASCDARRPDQVLDRLTTLQEDGAPALLGRAKIALLGRALRSGRLPQNQAARRLGGLYVSAPGLSPEERDYLLYFSVMADEERAHPAGDGQLDAVNKELLKFTGLYERRLPEVCATALDPRARRLSVC